MAHYTYNNLVLSNKYNTILSIPREIAHLNRSN